MDWKAQGEGPVWLPILNDAEDEIGLPKDLLARVAFEASRFRSDVIEGMLPSSTGALGIMQLRPEFFGSVRRLPPFPVPEIMEQIDEAAKELVRLYNHFQDWGFAIAAYHGGEESVEQHLHGGSPLPASAVDYVREVLADIPLGTSMKL